MEIPNGTEGYRACGAHAKKHGRESLFTSPIAYLRHYANSSKDQMKAYYSCFDVEYLKSERILWAAMNNETLCCAIDELIAEKTTI